MASSPTSRQWLWWCAQSSEGTDELLDSLEARVGQSDFDGLLEQQRLEGNSGIEEHDCGREECQDNKQQCTTLMSSDCEGGDEVLHAEWWAVLGKESSSFEQNATVLEETGEYVIVNKSDVIDALSTFIAAYIVSLPESRDMEARSLQRAVQQSLKEIRKSKVKKLWDYGRSVYRAAALGYGAFAAYTNPWLAEAVLKAAFTCARYAGALLW